MACVAGWRVLNQGVEAVEEREAFVKERISADFGAVSGGGPGRKREA